MSDSRRRKLPWHQRPRAWFRGWRYYLRRPWYEEEEEQPLTDDHGNHIGDLFPEDFDERDVRSCPCGRRDYDLCPVHRDEQPAPGSVWQAARLEDGTLLPVDGEPSPAGYNPAWMSCAFTPEVPREEVMPVERAAQDGLHLHDVPRRPFADVPRPAPGPSGLPSIGHGPGYRQNVPRRGQVTEGSLARGEIRGGSPRGEAAPGHLTMWDLVHVRSPWPPRTWPPILSGPRIRPELRTALLAGAR